MLTDDEVSVFNIGRPHRLRLVNLTHEQWQRIDAMLPREPRYTDSLDLLREVTYYWKYAAGPSPKTHKRRVIQGAAQLRAAVKAFSGATPTETVKKICALLQRR